MATSAQIFDVRLQIDDPSGFVAIVEVADPASLPAAPEPQTVYKVTSIGRYVITDKTTGAVADDYENVFLRLSDVRIAAWIDANSVSYAVCQSLKQILTKIGQELTIRRNQGGAESVEYTSLADTYSYYKALYDTCREDQRKTDRTSTGRWGGSKAPVLFGGNL